MKYAEIVINISSKATDIHTDIIQHKLTNARSDIESKYNYLFT